MGWYCPPPLKAVDCVVRHLQQGEHQAWDAYVYRCPNASHCHLSGWGRVIERSYGHQPFYLWAWANGEIKGLLPLIRMRRFPWRRSLVSLPFLDDGGLCSMDAQSRAQLYEAAYRLFEEQHADVLELRHRSRTELALPVRGSKVILSLALAAHPDTMWQRFNAKLRNQIRKAMKSGLTATWSGREGLVDFYEVFAANMRDLGSPVHSRQFFAAIFDEFAESAQLMLVRKGQHTIGGAVCLSFRGTLLVPWASSDRAYFSLCPNNLLYWEMIRWGCEQGYRRFDFGRSSPQSGTYYFKKQWGTVEEPLHWQCLSRKPGHAVMLHVDDPKYQWLIQAWRRLPLSLTKVVGPWVRGQVSS
jgi:FemAB-related protein (PEP-CTERM system-associated)